MVRIMTVINHVVELEYLDKRKNRNRILYKESPYYKIPKQKTLDKWFKK